MVSRLRRFFDIRPGEGLPVLLTFIYIAVVIAAYVLARAVRNGLFIEQFGPNALVYVYAASPIALSFFVPGYTRLTSMLGGRRITTSTLIFFSLNVMVFWWLFERHPSPWITAVFYVWVNCFGVIAPVHAWSYTASLFDTRQARRLFGVIGSGASLGAITGGLLARVLVGPMGGSVRLLLFLALLMLLAATVVTLANNWIPKRGSMRMGSGGIGAFAKTVRQILDTPYLRLIAAIVFLGAIVTQWTSLQLNLVAALHFHEDANALTRFNGTFTLALGTISFIVQLFATSQALRRFGLGVTILILPLFLGLGSALIVVLPAFWPVLITNSFDQALRFSVDKPTYELLYLPIAQSERLPLKNAIDIVGTRIADGVGAVLYGILTAGFLFIPGLGLSLRGTSAVNLILIGGWVAVGWRLRSAYVKTIQDSIHQHRLDTERTSAAVLDRSAADALREKLSGHDPNDVRYALELLEVQRTKSWHPALRLLLEHPEPDIRRRALALLCGAGNREIAADATRLLRDPDLGVRTEALLFLSREMGLDPLQQIERLGDFEDFSIRSGMTAFLASPGRAQNVDAARQLLEMMIASDNPRERAEAARVVALVPDQFGAELAQLIADPDLEVARVALATASTVTRQETIPALFDALGRADLSDDAATALAKFGDDVVPDAGRRLENPETPIEVRRELPGLLVRIGTVAAEQALIARMLQSDATLRHRIVASLNKLRLIHPEVRLDPAAVELLLAAEIAGHYRSYQILGPLMGRLSDRDPVIEAMDHSREQELERIFRVMALLFPHAGLHDAYVGVRSTNPVVRGNALEFLDNILKPELRQILVPLLDSQVTIAERIALANRYVGAPLETPEQAVTTLLASEDAWMRSCAVYAIGALKLDSLQPELRRLENADDPVVRESARNARRRLSGEAEPTSVAEPAPAAISAGIGAG